MTIERVLVSGGTGFVGSHVALCLLRQNVPVRLLVRDPGKAEAYYADCLGRALPDLNGLEIVQGDITDRAAVRAALTGCDALVHAAAGTPINAGPTEALFATNVGGTRNAVGAALDAGIERIVYLSSITAIFNVDASKVVGDAPLAQTRLPYGRSKARAEQYLRELQADGAPIAIVYPGGVIGPDDPGLSDTFKALIHRFNQGFRITEGGMQHVDVRDLALFVSGLIQAEPESGRYLLPGPYLRWAQLAALVEAVSGASLDKRAAKGWVFRAVGRYYDFKRLFTEVDSPISAETMRYSTQWPEVATSPRFHRLGLAYREPAETFRDSLRWLVEQGHLRRDQAPLL